MLANNAEGGTNGVTPTTSDAGSGDAFTTVSNGPNSILTYSNTAAAHGILGYQVANHSATVESNFVSWTNPVAQSSWFGRFYLAYTGGTVQQNIVRWKNVGTTLGTLTFPSSRKLLLSAGAGGTAYTSATTLAKNTWYRVEWNFLLDGSTAATFQLRIYLKDNTTPLEDSGQLPETMAAPQSKFGVIEHGQTNTVANAPSATDFLYLDDLVSFATAWPGLALPSSTFLAPAATLLTAA